MPRVRHHLSLGTSNEAHRPALEAVRRAAAHGAVVVAASEDAGVRWYQESGDGGRRESRVAAVRTTYALAGGTGRIIIATAVSERDSGCSTRPEPPADQLCRCECNRVRRQGRRSDRLRTGTAAVYDSRDAGARTTFSGGRTRWGSVHVIREADVLVIGGGPAGATAAGLLASWGQSVVLVHRAAGQPDLAESLPASTRKLLRFLGQLEAVDAALSSKLRERVVVGR